MVRLQRPWTLFAGVLVGYGLLATASYELFGASEIGVTFFPPAGLSFAALIVAPYRWWWTVGVAIVVGEMTVNVAQGNEVWWSASWAGVNLVEPLVGALVVRRLMSAVEYSAEFARAFALGALVGPAVGATAGATVQVVYGDNEWLDGWVAVWVGDGLGVLVVAPLVLALCTASWSDADRSWAALGALAAIGTITLGVYGTDERIFGYLTIPVLAWSALRLGPVGLSVLAALAATALTSATAQGRWPPFVEPAHPGLVRQQVFLLVAIGGSWLLGIEARKKTAALLAASAVERDLELARRQAVDADRLIRFNRMLVALTDARTTSDIASAVTQNIMDVVDVDEVVLVVVADPFEDADGRTPNSTTITALVRRGDRINESVPDDHPVWSSFDRVPPSSMASADRSLALPLRLGTGEIMGMLWFQRDEAWPVRLLPGCIAIGALVTGALERARRSERDHEVATLLQRSLIPPRQRVHRPGFEAAALYRPGTGSLMVGGDWYSLIERDRSVSVAVGDVVGHGLEAAATMGRVSGAAHAFGRLDLSPSEMIDLVEEAVAETPGADMTTMLQTRFDLDSGLLTYCRAGHPPPLVRFPDGRCEFLEDGHGPPLGRLANDVRSNGSLHLAPGSLLICYTDGLVEWRHTTIDRRLADLREVVAGLCDAHPAELADQVADAMVAIEPSNDDIVVVCCRTMVS